VHQNLFSTSVRSRSAHIGRPPSCLVDSTLNGRCTRAVTRHWGQEDARARGLSRRIQGPRGFGLDVSSVFRHCLQLGTSAGLVQSTTIAASCSHHQLRRVDAATRSLILRLFVHHGPLNRQLYPSPTSNVWSFEFQHGVGSRYCRLRAMADIHGSSPCCSNTFCLAVLSESVLFLRDFPSPDCILRIV
jgi:hypothetical protein